MSPVFLTLFLIGITVEGITGALAAGRLKMDLFGVVMVACMTAFGGGTIRNLCLGHYPMIWIAHPEYVALVAVAALLTTVIAPFIDRLKLLFLALDALGLSVFTIVGIKVALSISPDPWAAILAGMMTGIFGGVIRDMLCNRVPLVFHEELYAVVSLGAGGLYLLLLQWETHTGVASAVTIVCGFTVRMLAIRYKWCLPSFNYSVPGK